GSTVRARRVRSDSAAAGTAGTLPVRPSRRQRPSEAITPRSRGSHPHWVYGPGMPRTIQIRDVPDEVHAELRRRAAEAGTSLSDYVADELRRVATRSANAEVLLRSAQRS